MSKAKSFDDGHWNLMSALADAVEDASDEDIVEECVSQGEDPALVADRVRDIFEHVLREDKFDRLKQARVDYDQRVALSQDSSYDLPASPLERRKLLQLVVSQAPQRLSELTIQHRDFSDLTDDDIESCLEDLAHLGILDQVLGSDD